MSDKHNEIRHNEIRHNEIRVGSGEVRQEAALRRCLRCGASFPSEWAGERICARCKSTTAWRQGVPARPHPDR